MDVEVSFEGDIATLALIGQFWESEDFALLEQQVTEVLAQSPHVLILDLARLTFISSQGLGRFVRTYSQAKEQGANTVLLHPGGSVKETIELSGFAEFMIIADSRTQIQDL